MRVVLLTSIFTIGLGVTFATTTDELKLVSGTHTVTITDSVGLVAGTCTGTVADCFLINAPGGFYDTNTAAGTMTVASANFDGWVISGTIGVSHSPGLTPFGIDISSLTATCSTAICSTNQLQVWYGDVNFDIPVGVNGFTTGFSATDTGNGSATQKAWFDNGNGIFGTTTAIGTVGAFSGAGTFAGSANGGAIASNTSYSLTLEQLFSVNSPGAAAGFSVDGNITAVPEPGAVVLFGTVLGLCASSLRRRRKS